MVAQCVKQMDVSSDSSEDHSGVLGLTAERVKRQMPPEQVLRPFPSLDAHEIN